MTVPKPFSSVTVGQPPLRLDDHRVLLGEQGDANVDVLHSRADHNQPQRLIGVLHVHLADPDRLALLINGYQKDLL